MSWDGEIVDEKPALNAKQVERVIRMNELLRDDMMALSQVLEIKIAISKNDHAYAVGLFKEFTNTEQQALWVAPKFAGIFTTAERKVLHP